jgi:hypothetical protein
MTDVYVDCFKNAPPEFFEITSHALDALWYVDMTIDKESMMSLIYKVHDIECKLSDFSSRFYLIALLPLGKRNSALLRMISRYFMYFYHRNYSYNKL